MEEKGTAMLWHYGNAEPEFGVMQARLQLTLHAGVFVGGVVIAVAVADVGRQYKKQATARKPG